MPSSFIERVNTIIYVIPHLPAWAEQSVRPFVRDTIKLVLQLRERTLVATIVGLTYRHTLLTTSLILLSYHGMHGSFLIE